MQQKKEEREFLILSREELAQLRGGDNSSEESFDVLGVNNKNKASNCLCDNRPGISMTNKNSEVGCKCLCTPAT